GLHRDGRYLPLGISVSKQIMQDRKILICAVRDNSDQNAYEQALSQSEQRYHGMIDSQNTLVTCVDQQGCFVFANNAYCRMFDKSLDDLLGKIFTPLVHPEYIAKTEAALRLLETPPHRVAFEQRVMTANGWRWIAWEESVIVDVAENLYQIQAVGVDITEQKNTEEELTNKIGWLAGLLNSIPDIVFYKDVQGVYLGCNHEFSRFIGRPVEEIIKKTDYDLFDPETARSFRENDVRMVAEGQQRHNEEWIKYPDGTPILLDTLKAPLYDLNGKTIGILGISRDITARKKNEEVTIIERNLAIILAQKSSLIDALPLCLDLILEVSGMDCGGIYLLDRQNQDLLLKTHKGLSDVFIAQALKYEKGTDHYRLVMQGDPIYQPYLQTPIYKSSDDLSEGLRFLGIMPVKANEDVIACINIASHTVDSLTDYNRRGLESLTAQIGNMIVRFQVQDELLEKQREFQSMFDSLQDYLFVLDTEGAIVEVNQKVLDSLGYSRMELLGESVLKVHPPEQRAKAWQIVGDMLSGLIETCPLDLLKKDGAHISVETKVVPGRWGNRDVLIGVSRDITERKAAEDARIEQTRLLEYRHQFETILTAISTHFINLPSSEINREINNVLKQIGEFENIDRSYVFMLDTDAGLMANTHEWCAQGIEPQIDNLKDIPISIFPWWMKKLENLEEVHIPFVSQLPFEAQAEREILEAQSIQSVLVVPLVLHNSLVGFLGFDSVSTQRVWLPDSVLLIKMVGDILSNALMRIQMQSELAQSESRNTALLSAVPDMIFRIRQDGIFLDYKASAVDLLAVPVDKIVGTSISTIMPDDLAKEALAGIEQALITREIQTMEYTLKIGDSSHVFEARFKDCGPDEVTAIVREISERARLEQMKSDFINRATHELRTPIATMLLMVNLMDGGSTGEEYQEYWGVLKGELSRERQLVEDLLSAGRLESNQAHLHFRFLDCAEVIRQVVHLAELPAREKNISLNLFTGDNLDETTFVINADESALTQVFVNLISNAIKFTPTDGRIDVTLKGVNLGVQISILDTGMGIPSEDLPLLFNRFFRGTNAIYNEIPGTGIGLYIVRSILEKHGGNIKVYSEINKGSQFDIWLPLNQN
ncbi:MAG: PAS domain S-box protein, partial [Chloroflexota bacterium]